MSKQRSDPNERDNSGPLFAPRLTTLFSPGDPETGRRAAVKMLESGALGEHQRIALDLVKQYPGRTPRDLGWLARHDGEEVEHAKLRVARRLNELEKAGLIHRSGERDGCCLWWPGPKQEVR